MIADSRTAVTGALAAVGLRVAKVGDKIVSPVALIEPGDPWVEPAGMSGHRIIRWRVHLISGLADQPAQAEQVDALAELADTAFAGAPANGLSAMSIAQPGVLTIAGVTYLATRADVTHRTNGGT
jgi:hypothetical protein